MLGKREVIFYYIKRRHVRTKLQIHVLVLDDMTIKLTLAIEIKISFVIIGIIHNEEI